MSRRVIIAGSRGFKDAELMDRKMKTFLRGVDVEYIISGMAAGADRLGHTWAIDNGYRVKEMPADWNSFGKSAGFIRNSAMLELAGPTGILVAFWDGKSRGTRDTIFKALDMGLEVFIVRFHPNPGTIVRRKDHVSAGNSQANSGADSDAGAMAPESPR